METLLANLAAHGAIDENGCIVLDQYQTVEPTVFAAMFGVAADAEGDTYTNLVAADSNGDGTFKGYARFFDAWRSAGVI
jgi:hypothetical protein